MAIEALAPSERHDPRVIFDAARVWTTLRGELRESVNFDRIDEIIIITNDRGPYGEDIFWMLAGGDEGLVFGQGWPGADALVEKLMELPGFDHKKMIDAMGSVGEGRFSVWNA